MAESKPSTSNYTSIQWSQPCRQIEYPEILLATENFNESLVIGCGGFGKVYKGNINNGSKLVVAAIKRLDSMSDQGETEFWAEVEMLSKLHHAYLVSLIGYCSYEKEFILVYEYMPNGTLSDHLHKLGTHLSWLKRLRICIGAGRGLDYLHTGTGIEFGVIHRDVKSSNILLNERWAAKVSDFGLSRISPANQPSTYVNTLIKGTFGYLDPNYFATGKLTRKSDVYAFGVVLFEVLCRKRPLDPSLDWGLATWAQDSIKEGNMKHMIDYDIKSQISPKCLKEFVRIAQRCLDNHPKHRPTMGEVVVGLESILTLQEKQTSGKTLFGRMIDMFPFPSKPENSDIPISSNFVTCVSVETLPPTRLDVYQTKNLEDLDTHNLALNAIIAALEDESKQIIGIYGIGGVGKTTLAMEVAARVKKTNMLFAAVAFTTVSQNIDVDKIKKDIGEATKRIMNGDKILIILDDVWEKLNLEELCIPYGSNYMNCKILLTSRSEKVCQKMNARSKICVNSLPTKEAWILFKRVVGERVETDANLKPVALKVVEECGGLPLLIQAVGNALKDESIESWSRALSQLKKNAPSDIDEEIRKSFIHLKLSYEYLKSEEAKSCFLLCSLFPEDYDISLEDLVHYGVGLGKYDDQDSIEDARGRVQNAVNILTSSGLLLNVEYDKGCTKMHDVVRDVALLIASQGNNKFLVKAGHGLTEWLPKRSASLERYTGISLMDNKIRKLPDYKVYLPHLEIFVVCTNNLSMISDEFIGCMKNLKVLDISWNDISSLPQSFQLLKKLRTLDLRGNKSLCEISILGELKDLEILFLNDTGITEIPREIAQLVNLRVLQVKDCMNLCRIKQGVISALSMLEELCIDLSRMTKGVNGCIEEVMELSMLTYLDLKVERFDLIPEGFNIENLKGFLIQIGEIGVFYKKLVHRRSDRCLVIVSKHHMIPLLKKLIVVSRPRIFLFEIENLNNVMPTLYDEVFNKLEHIELYNCSNVSCLVDDGIKRCDGVEGKTEEKFFKDLKHLELRCLYNLEVLWKCPNEYISLTNLVTISIIRCNKLVRVFTVSVAQGLINLKKLDIEDCDGLKEVIWGGEDDDQSENVIVFPSLVEISFDGLTSLKSFYPGNFSVKYPSLVEVEIVYCDRMEIWGPGIHETPNLKTLVVNGGVSIAVDGPFAINKAVEKSQAAAAVYERMAMMMRRRRMR